MSRVAYLGIFILIAFVGVSIVLSQQTRTPQVAGTDGGPAITATSSTPYVPADQGEAKGSVPNFQPGSNDLRAAILAQPLPQIWLESPAQGSLGGSKEKHADAIRIDLSDEARAPLTSVWQAYLEYYLKTKFVDEKEAQNRVDQDVAMVATAARTEASLEALSIDAPNGRRRISHDEALGIVSFLGRSANGIVEQAKQYKK
jgi:hypothetical protein